MSNKSIAWIVLGLSGLNGGIGLAQADCVTRVETKCVLEVTPGVFLHADGSGPLDGEFVRASSPNPELARIAIREACEMRFARTVNTWSLSAFDACKRYLKENPGLLVCAPAQTTTCSCD